MISCFIKSKRLLLCGLLLIFIIGWATMVYAERTQSALAQSVVRFHVLANSDSAEDQALKMEVKNMVLSELRPELSVSRSVEETRDFLSSRLKCIETDVSAYIQTLGYNYPVKVSLDNAVFPATTYGNVTFFPGEYQALRIVIGEGEGQNWWCVVFPPLCYVDVAKDYTSEEELLLLRSISDMDYLLLTGEAREENVTVNVRFKVVETWQNLLHRNRSFESDNDSLVARERSRAE